MDQIFQTLLSWQFLLLGLGISAIMFVFRKVAEYLMDRFSANKSNKLWTDVILPITPVILGAVIGLAFKQFPYPNDLSSGGGRLLFGLVSGLSSGLLYRVLKTILLQKITGADIDVDSTKNDAPGKPSIDK